MIDRWTLETGRPPHQNDRVRYNHRRGWSPSRNQGVSKGLRLRLGRYDGSRQLETAVGGCRSSAQSRPGGRVQQRPGSSTTTRPGWLGAAESDLASAVESALDLETRMSTAASAVVDSRHEPRAHSPSRRTFSQAKTSPLTFARRRSIRMVAPCRRGCTEGSPLERTHRYVLRSSSLERAWLTHNAQSNPTHPRRLQRPLLRQRCIDQMPLRASLERRAHTRRKYMRDPISCRPVRAITFVTIFANWPGR